MNYKEIMETLQQNKKEKKTGIVLMLIASLLAFAAAIYGAFRFGEKKGAQQAHGAKGAPASDVESAAKARKKSEKEAASEKNRKGNASGGQAAVPQPVYVVRPLHEKKHESRGKRFRRHMCSAAAAILVISIAGSSAMQYVEPSDVLAKESFTGIGKIVEEYSDKDEPYVILDVVPADAEYTLVSDPDDDGISQGLGTYSFTIGTMGYLVNGQASIIDDLAENLKNNPNAYSYEVRKKLFDNVMVSGSGLELKYEEAYPGVDSVDASAGWIQIFGSTDVDTYTGIEGYASGNDSVALDEDEDNVNDSTDSPSYATGQFYGTWDSRTEISGAAGYDYEMKSANRNISDLMLDSGYKVAVSGDRYELKKNNEDNENGAAYRLQFEFDRTAAPDELIGGYVAVPVESLKDARGSYTYTTCVYELVDGVYEYRGTIAGLLGVEDEWDISGAENAESEETDADKKTEGEGEGEKAEGEEGEKIEGEEGEKAEGEEGEKAEGEEGENAEGEEGEKIEGEGEKAEGEEDEKIEGEEDEKVEGEEVGIDPRNADGTQQVRVGYSVSESFIVASNSSVSDGWRELAEEGMTEEWPFYDGRYENYTIVVFRYEPEPAEGELLYKVSGREEIKVFPPYDSYILLGADSSEDLTSTMEMQENMQVIPYANEQNTSSSAVEFEYVGSGKGHYKLTRDNANGQLIEVQGAPVYFRCTGGKDWLKQFVFSSLAGGDNDESNFRIVVNTVRADQLRYEHVQEADLIFLESGYKNEVLNTGIMTLHFIGDDEEHPDMTETAVSWILQSAVESKPVIVDHDIAESEDHYQESNYQYLAKALLKSNLEEFYEKINDSGNLLANLKMGVKDTNKFPDKTDNTYHYVNRNVYVVGSSAALVDGDFSERFSSDAGFRDVTITIQMENDISPDNPIKEYVSKARAVQYIINFSVGIIGDIKNLKVLEIQPSANRHTDLSHEGSGNKLTWKTDDMKTAKTIFSDDKAFEYDYDLKSVVEFNGEWEDINGAYDFIFIGLDGQRLNQVDGEIKYNDEEYLRHTVYHPGDDSDRGRYDANDLTTQKMEDLIEYMDAGYPVLVENNCFTGLSAQDADEDDVNTYYIHEDSNMYRFLQRAVREEKYQNCIFTVNDIGRSPMFMNKVCLAKPSVDLVAVDESGEVTDEDVPAIQSLELDENNKYHGQIHYRIKNSRNTDEDYPWNTVVRVYADYNYDGYFADAEEVTEFLNVDNVLDVMIEGMGPGILPWKLEVYDENNEYRRDSVQGYFELPGTVEDELKVLQITEKKGDSKVDLQQMFHLNTDKSNASLLKTYLQGAEGHLNVEMQFETVTAKQLVDRIAENSGYLEQWDVVVLTLDGAEADSANYAALSSSVDEYVGKGRSLLVCGQEPGDYRAGLSADLLGQTESEKTFVNIGAESGSEYRRYAGLTGDMFGKQNNLRVDEVNNGIVSVYPYTIQSSDFRFGSKTALQASTYLLDFENQINSEAETTSFVTVWYTLGSSNIDRSAYYISPKDARNNYYCYSKGNVVYLAQSEYNYTYDSQNKAPEFEDGADECKLFVNALVAAYSAGLHNAHINIVSGFSTDAADIQTISVPYDEQWLNLDADSETPTFGILDKTVDVYFKFNDNNFAAQKTTYIGFYYEDENGEEELPVDGKQKRGTAFPSEIWTVSDENKLVQVALDELQPGKVYRIKAPVIPLQNKTSFTDREEANKADIYVVLETEFVRAGKTYKIRSADSVSLNRAQLFRLE